VAASCASIGSVRGYDELFAFNPSVVFERRTYQTIEGMTKLELQSVQNSKDVAVETSLQLIWPHAARGSVVARGSWDGWQSDVPLTKQSNGSWIADLPSKETDCQYKFIVDGTWTYDGSQPTISDGQGGLNNVPTTAADKNGVGGPDVRPSNQAKLPGIYVVKQVLNALHVRLAQEDYLELSGQHLAENIVAVQRRSPSTCQSTWFITSSAFAKSGLHDGLPHDMAVLRIPDRVSQLHVAATLFVQDHAGECSSKPGTMSGLESHLRLYNSLEEVAYVWCEDGMTCLKLHYFPPGSVLVFSTEPRHFSSNGLEQLLSVDTIEGLKLQNLSLSDLSYLLYSCEAEELDRSNGTRGSYDIPGFGPLVYSGLMGICAALDGLRASSTDVSKSALVANFREGDCLLNYLVDRLGDWPSLQQVRKWLQKVQALLAKLPRQLVPFYFDLCVSTLCSAACNSLLSTSGPFVSRHVAYGPLVRDLALATAQFWGAVPSAPLHWDRAKEVGWRVMPSLSAGLPHFSSGFMRNWGRDTFIALRGCLLVTHRFAEARDVLLVCAGVVRHGLVPNLLDAANNPRYNARDATWFFLQGIQDYVEMAPEGKAFLTAPVSLKWPVRDWDASLAGLEPATVADLIHLILSAHAKGIHFREWNAGKNIDEHMTHEGFNIDVRLDESSGLIFGGNAHNCGTWMDKMGSCEHAGNKGVPATPRDGAAIEINGLLKSTLRWVVSLHKAGDFKYGSVKTSSQAELSYEDWDARLQGSFEDKFWVSHDERISSSLRGFYRDTVGATQNWQDAQLRPNLCIAMAVAPELFFPANAKEALKLVAQRLLGPLGMCTLDPADPEYRGDYHNDNDSHDKAVAHGWNYHQGPEWVWPLGFFLRAWFHFVGSDDEKSIRSSEAMRRLLCHRIHLAQSPWRSLPELTNSKGQTCHHSCPAQAWSLATILDALHAAAKA
jgi:glycogen debranching enzyme